MKKKLTAVLVLIACMWMMAFTVSAATPALSKTSVTTRVGLQSKLTVKNASGTITWSTSNKNIVQVNKNGVIKGVRAGSAVVRARVKNKTLSCKVTVKRNYRTYANTSVTRNSTGVTFVHKSLEYNTKGQLIVKGYIVNQTGFPFWALSNCQMQVKAGNTVIARGGFGTISRIVYPNQYFMHTFIFAKSDVCKVVNLANANLSVKYSWRS